MPSVETWIITCAVFLLAGGVKGVVGLGLPTVSLGLLTVTLGLTEAMALMLVPSFVTNVWQAVSGGHLRGLLARLWPFLLVASFMIFLGVAVLRAVDIALLTVALGILTAVYGASGLVGARLSISSGAERLFGPVFGALNGLLTGMTGSSVFPGVLFLQGIGLPRDQLVQAMGILFGLSTVILAIAMGGSGFLSLNLGLLSVAGVLPALLGMSLGKRLRSRLPEQTFRRALFSALLILGAYIAIRTLASS